MFWHLEFLLLVTLSVGLPNKRFDTEDLKDALQKVQLKEILEKHTLNETTDLQQTAQPVTLDENQTETSTQSWKEKPKSGDAIDLFFNHPDPNSELANEIASFVIEDNGEKNTSHHPKGIETVEKMKSKLIGEDHDIDKTLPDQTTSQPDTREQKHLEKKSFPLGASLWPGGVVPYNIDQSLSDPNFTKAINEAIKQFHDKTCVRWVPRLSPEAQGLSHKHYINMTSSSGCFSYIGMLSWEVQPLGLLKPLCIDVPTIIHEMCHAIGQTHEMARSDRDDHLTMNWSNLDVPKTNANVAKVATENYSPYDLESILQYSLYAWIKGPGKSMTPTDNRLTFLASSATGLMYYDAQIINMAYKCAVNCTNVGQCKNDGFLLQNCTCFCPEHLTGASCETLLTDQDCGGTITLDYLQSKEITSPLYQKNYPVNKTCVWVIQAPVGSFVKLTINEFNLAYSRILCYHWLEVRYNLMGQHGPRFCSKMNSQSYTTSKEGSPNLMMLVFDSMVVDRAATKGFNLTVKAVGTGCAYAPCVLGDCIVDANGNYTCLCDRNVTGAACNVVNEFTTVNCTFEDGSHCFMTNSPSDDFDWSLETTYTLTANTGPTLAREGSKYKFIESSYPQTKGMKAVLISDVDLAGHEHCLTMWYHMYGSDMGSLKVKNSNTTLWSKSGDQGNSWKKVYIDVPLASREKFLIEGEVGGNKGDIAIDDLKLFPAACSCASVQCRNGGSCIVKDGTPTCICPVGVSGVECEESVCDINDCMSGTCSPNPNDGFSYLCHCQDGVTGKLCDTYSDTGPISCTFEPDTPCCLHNMTTSDDFDWLVKSGRTPTSFTGPRSAHGGLYYSFIEASSPRITGNKAILLSTKFKSVTRCLKFWYHMYGRGIGHLTLSLNGNPVLTLSGNKGNQWKEAYVDIPDNDTYEVQFIGVRGRNYQGDIAIDDIIVSSGTCACKKNPCVNGKCADDLSLPTWYNCTCNLGFVGVNCETHICQTNPCVTNADCLEDLTSINGYKCVCKPGYVGDDCHDDGTVQMICDYEPNSPCFLENVGGDATDWTLITASTVKSDLRPRAKKGNQSICITKSFVTADLKPNIVLLPAKRCLVFWYYMYEFIDYPGELQVLDSGKVLWSVKGNQGRQWHQGRVNLPKSQNFQLIVRGTSTYNLMGTIALDYVQLYLGTCQCRGNPCGSGGTCAGDASKADGYKCTCYPGYSGQYCSTSVCDSVDCGVGKCQYDASTSGTTCVCMDGITGSQCNQILANATLTCDYETDLPCFLKNAQTDKYDWMTNEGYTETAWTGPSGAFHGSTYIYAEATGLLHPGENAVLTSAVTLSDAHCLNFYYNVYGYGMGTLNVLTNHGTVWSVSNSREKEWKKSKVTINPNDSWVSFEAVRGSNSYSDIALDLITLSPGVCN